MIEEVLDSRRLRVTVVGDEANESRSHISDTFFPGSTFWSYYLAFDKGTVCLSTLPRG
jgi:hypothetical protein